MDPWAYAFSVTLPAWASTIYETPIHFAARSRMSAAPWPDLPQLAVLHSTEASSSSTSTEIDEESRMMSEATHSVQAVANNITHVGSSRISRKRKKKKKKKKKVKKSDTILTQSDPEPTSTSHTAQKPIKEQRGQRPLRLGRHVLDPQEVQSYHGLLKTAGDQWQPCMLSYHNGDILASVVLV